MTGSEGGPPAGWYDEPTGGSGSRWWDGTKWTDDSSPYSSTDAVGHGSPDGPQPGWYADPTGVSTSRWWDGTQWTTDVGGAAPAETAAAAGPLSPPIGPGGSLRTKLIVAAIGTIAVGGVALAVANSGGGSGSSRAVSHSVSSSSSLPAATSAPATASTTPATSPPVTAAPATALGGTYASKISYPPGCGTAVTPLTGKVSTDSSAGTVTFDFNAGSLLVAQLNGLSFHLFDPSVNTTYDGSFDTSGPAPTFHMEASASPNDRCQTQVIDGTKVSG